MLGSRTRPSDTRKPPGHSTRCQRCKHLQNYPGGHTPLSLWGRAPKTTPPHTTPKHFTNDIAISRAILITRRDKYNTSSDFLALQCQLMSLGGGWIRSAEWRAEDERWYADLIAQCDGVETSADAPSEAPSAVLARLNTRPWTECCHMIGNDSEDGWYTDGAHQTWTADRKGRWSAKIAKKKVYLHHRVVQLQPNRARRADDVVSHICGNCDCVRLEHLRYQPKREDTRDNAHHKRVQRLAERGIVLCKIRPELM